MLPDFAHTFTKKLSNHEKKLVFDFIQIIILENSKANFMIDTDTLKCRVPFFVSRWNPYGIFDTLRCTFENTESGNTKIRLQTFHVRAMMAKI